jgi:hypothetical protein
MISRPHKTIHRTFGMRAEVRIHGIPGVPHMERRLMGAGRRSLRGGPWQLLARPRQEAVYSREQWKPGPNRELWRVMTV